MASDAPLALQLPAGWPECNGRCAFSDLVNLLLLYLPLLWCCFRLHFHCCSYFMLSYASLVFEWAFSSHISLF